MAIVTNVPAIALITIGVVGAPWSLWIATTKRRPIDLLGALLAPIAIVCALIGGVWLLVPGFVS